MTRLVTLSLIIFAFPCAISGAEPSPVEKPATTEPAGPLVPKDILEKLKLPGLKINLEERAVDVEASICLDRGMLELIACTKDSKEHEAILMVSAKAVHIHTALLLLRAKPGNPAMRRQVDGEEGRWIDIPPRGGEIGVYLVFKNKEDKMVEHPISDFIKHGADESGDPSDTKKIKFPTHNFIFAGSQLVGDGPEPKKYLSDESGNVISIVTFGDEMLCLPEVHAQDNASLVWEVDPTNLPPLDTKVILRLRPVVEAAEKKIAPNAPPIPKP